MAESSRLEPWKCHELMAVLFAFTEWQSGRISEKQLVAVMVDMADRVCGESEK